MKRKQKTLMTQLSRRQQQEQIKKNLFGSNKIEYKYINTMGGYIITTNAEHNLGDISVAKRLGININEYKKLVEEFRCMEYRGISYFDSIEKIEAMLVMIALLR